VQRAIGATLIALFISGIALLLEGINIADPDLRYPIVLLTKVLGAIIIFILMVRVALLVVKGKVLTTAPHAYGGIKNLGTVLFVTVASLMACLFGVSLMVEKSGSIAYWPLVIVFIFGGLGAHGSRYLWREWRMYQRLRSRL
jgi:hypothetical protein